MKKPSSLISLLLLLLQQTSVSAQFSTDCDVQKKRCDALFPHIIDQIDKELNKPQYFRSSINAQRYELSQLNHCYQSALMFRPDCRNISPYQSFVASVLPTACDSHDFNCDRSAAHKGIDHFGSSANKNDCAWDDLFCDNGPSLSS